MTTKNDVLIHSMKSFNTKLVKSLRKLNFREYFEDAYAKYFSHVDISFMGEFLELSTTDGTFIVPQEMLKKYGVLTSIDTSQKVKRCLDQYDLTEGSDYRVDNVGQPVKQGGVSTKKMYTLSVDAFKLCLIRAKNSRKYASYYLTLERVVAFYYQYLTQYDANLISMKDDKIDRLEAQLAEVLGNTRKIIDRNDELIDRNEEIIEKLENSEIQKEKLEDKVDAIRDVLEDTLQDRNQRPQNTTIHHQFALLRSDSSLNEYKVIRGQRKRVSAEIKKLASTYSTIVTWEYDPNPIDMFNRFRELVKDEYATLRKNVSLLKIPANKKIEERKKLRENPPIRISRNDITINLAMINHNDFVTKIKECLDDKLKVELP